MESALAMAANLKPPWSSKLKSFLCDIPTSVDLWKESMSVTSFGIVGDILTHQILIDSVDFIPFAGLKLGGTSKAVTLLFEDCQIPCVPVGTLIGFADGVVKTVHPPVITMNQSSKLWFVPEFQPELEWQACHLFSGAFEGWAKALEWCCIKKICRVRHSIAVDCDQEVMRMWSLQNQAVFRVTTIPCDHTDANEKRGFCMPIHEFSWANWCRFPANEIFTASPPCQPWSAGGTSAGIECDNGFAFIQCLQSIKLVRPNFAIFESVDAIQQHKHFKILKMFMSLAAYELIWSAISKLDDLAPMRRSRWLAVWVRADIHTNKVSFNGSFGGVHRFSWDHPMYRCVVPELLSHQLVLSRHLRNIYGSIEYLPAAKRFKLGNSPSMNEVLMSRVLSPDEIMPTLCAMYSQQHELAPAHLGKRGIFAPLVLINGLYAFVDPVRFLSLLGMPVGFFNALPSKIDVSFHQLGNSVSVPQALCCILVAFASFTDGGLDIIHWVKKCWGERVSANDLIFITFRDAFLFTTPQDLSLWIDFGDDFHFVGEGISCLIPGLHEPLNIDPSWTIETFAFKCGFHELGKQGLYCCVDGTKSEWHTKISDILGRRFCISLKDVHILSADVQLPETQEWTQFDDEALISEVIHAEQCISSSFTLPSIILDSDYVIDGPFDRCFAFFEGASEPFVFVLPKNASDPSVWSQIEKQIQPASVSEFRFVECLVHPCVNVDRVFIVGRNNQDGIVVLVTKNNVFHVCTSISRQCIPINLAGDLSIRTSDVKVNGVQVGRFRLQTIPDFSWIDFSIDNSLPPASDIQNALDQRLSHFELTREALATDEMSFILRLIRSEVTDTHIGLLVDTCAHDHHQVLDNIRIAIRSIASLFEEGHKKVFLPILIPGHWCAVETTLQCDGTIKFVAVGFPQSIHQQVLHFAKICLFRVSNVVRTFTLPLCGFDGLCGWMVLKRWFKILDLSVPTEFNSLVFSQRQVAILDRFLPAEGIACKITRDLVLFARALRGAFLVNIATFEPSTVLRQNNPPWGRSGQDDVAMAPSQASSAKPAEKQEDPWLHFDPWKTGSKSCKWEDLKLPSDHPFVDATGASIPQVHRHKLNSNISGISFVTRSVVAEMIKLKPQKPSALLIPVSDKGLGNIQPPPKTDGPYEIVVEDTSSGSIYKRQVLMIVITAAVKFQLPKPTYTATLDDVREIVVELDSRFATKEILTALGEKPLETFKAKMIEQFPTAVNEHTNVYAFRKFNPKGSDENHSVFQVMCKLPSSKRKCVIERSGLGLLTTRDFVPKGQSVDDLTVIPRFWSADRTSHQEAVKATTGLDGFAGLIISKRGLAARAWVSSIGSLRQALIPNDERISELNLHIVPRHSIISTGWPVAINPSEVVKATHHAVGQAPIPTRCFRNQGVTSWLLAFQDPPKLMKFVVKFNSDIFEILLTEEGSKQPLRFAKKDAKKGGGKGSNYHPSPSVVSSATPSIDEALGDRVSVLEAKFQSFEKRQEKVENQLSSGFDSLQNQLRQVLQAITPGREKAPTGDTPPPKCPRNA